VLLVFSQNKVMKVKEGLLGKWKEKWGRGGLKRVIE
jgi:hypothetical protein